MSFAIRDFAGTSECQAEDGILITVSSFFEGAERAMLHLTCSMQQAQWCPILSAFRVAGDGRIYRPLEALPLLDMAPEPRVPPR